MSDPLRIEEVHQLCQTLHVDSSQMSLNIHDQIFISRVLNMHYEAFFEDIHTKIKELYEKQTKDLAEVIINYHNDHIKEIRKLSGCVNIIQTKVNKLQKDVSKHDRQIHNLKKVIEEIHHKEIDI